MILEGLYFFFNYIFEGIYLVLKFAYFNFKFSHFAMSVV